MSVDSLSSLNLTLNESEISSAPISSGSSITSVTVTNEETLIEPGEYLNNHGEANRVIAPIVS